MLKNKSLWNGIGIGLIAGAFLLQMMLWGSESASRDYTKNNSGATTWTDKHLETAAADAGFQLLPAEETWYSQAELDEALQAQRSESKTEPKEITVRSFIILPGMSSEQIADILLQLRIIEDKERFKAKLSENDLHTRIQAGLYYFDEPLPTLEEVVEKLTK